MHKINIPFPTIPHNISNYYLYKAVSDKLITRKQTNKKMLCDSGVLRLVAPLDMMTCEVLVPALINDDVARCIMISGLRDVIKDPIFSASDMHAWIC